jgi:hypothetical protein
VTDGDLADIGNGGHVDSSSGYDIIFYESTETTQLNHEIEKYTNTSGLLIFWVCVKSLSSTSDTIIYMYYGKKGVTVDPSSTSTWDSNFMAVWHMADTNDSTSNSVNLTNSGADADTGGKIGDCYHFIAANSDYMYENGTFLDTIPASDELTFESWFYLDSELTSMYICNKVNIEGRDRIALEYETGTDPDKIWFWGEANNAGTDYVQENDTTGTDVWTYAAGVYDAGSALKLYKDDEAVQTGDTLGSINNGSAFNFEVGRWYNGLYEKDGYIDELRISDKVRSANWIATTYETQNSPSTFMSFGDEQGIIGRELYLDARSYGLEVYVSEQVIDDTNKEVIANTLAYN